MDEKRRRMTEVHSAYRGRERDAQEREAQRFLQLSAQRKAQRAADRLDREAEAEADETQELLPPSAGGAPPPAAAEVAAALSPPRRGRRQARRSEAQRLLSSEPLASPPPAALATPATLALVGRLPRAARRGRMCPPSSWMRTKCGRSMWNWSPSRTRSHCSACAELDSRASYSSFAPTKAPSSTWTSLRRTLPARIELSACR